MIDCPQNLVASVGAVNSIQVQRQPVQTAKPGDEAGIKLDSKVRQNDKVYKVTT